MTAARPRSVLNITIPGAPRTKKNHSRIVRAGRFPKVLPSRQYEDWNRAAQAHLMLWRNKCQEPYGTFPLDVPLNCRALIYRDADRGDAIGYYQAVADALEDAGIVQNDVLIVSWDGSRLLKDPINPRVELKLEPW